MWIHVPQDKEGVPVGLIYKEKVGEISQARVILKLFVSLSGSH